MKPGSKPIATLVTGAPRSGTTWLARLLATSPGSALTGREPMNPHKHQYALSRTLSGWTRLHHLSPRQRRALALTYRGLNPLTVGRYGRRQWAAPLARTRLIVKDPYAMLSIPAIRRTTGCRTVLIYRHPGAVLASYRRMGWTPDVHQLQPIATQFSAAYDNWLLDTNSEAEALARSWVVLHEIALEGLCLEHDIVVSHSEIATNGNILGPQLFTRLGLCWNSNAKEQFGPPTVGTASDFTEPRPRRALHNFDRMPSEVADAWKSEVAPEDVTDIEAVAERMLSRLRACRIGTSEPGE